MGTFPMVQHLPTAQKAVANPLVCSTISYDPEDYRKVFIDNHSSSIKLAVFLCERCKILTAGTMHKISNYMDTDLMDITKKNIGKGQF